MLATERQNRLEAIIKESGSLPVSKLSDLLGVSEMTVRRDLNNLARFGKVARVHGGAVATGLLQFGSRLQKNMRVKKQAARKIAPTLPKVGCVYMDGSTTVFSLLDFIDPPQDLHIVTNNLQTFQRLCGIGGVKPLILGGSLDSRTDNLVGPMARRALQSLHFDRAYMSCFALDAEKGCMEATLEDAEVKAIVARQCDEVYLAVDEDKLGSSAAGSWEHVRERTVLATNLPARDERLKDFKANFRQVI